MAAIISLPDPHIAIIDIFGLMSADIDFTVYLIGDFIDEKIHDYATFIMNVVPSSRVTRYCLSPR